MARVENHALLTELVSDYILAKVIYTIDTGSIYVYTIDLCLHIHIFIQMFVSSLILDGLL